MSDLFHDSEMRSRFETAVGAIIREWAALETAMAMSLEALVGCDQFRARAIWLALPNYNARRKLIASLVTTYVHPTDAKKYSNLLRRTGKLAHNRNLIAHAGFVTDEGKTIRFVYDDNANTELEMNFACQEAHSITNIENWPKDIKTLWGEWIALSASLKPLRISALPKMHREAPQMKDGRRR